MVWRVKHIHVCLDMFSPTLKPLASSYHAQAACPHPSYDALADSSASSTAFPPVVKIFATFSWPCLSRSVGSVRLGSPSTKRLYRTTLSLVSSFSWTAQVSESTYS